jgi:hypothetical protein
MRAIAVLVLLFVVFAAVPAPAQQVRRDAEAWRALAAAIEPGAYVSVRTRDGARVRGTLVQPTETGLLVKPKTRLPMPMRTIAYADIEALERWKPGMNPAAKVLLGTGIGAGAMLLVGALIVALVGYD